MSKFLSVRAKLMSTIVLSLIGFVVLSWTAMSNLQVTGHHLDEAYTKMVPTVDYMGRMGVARGQLGFYLWAVVAINDDPKNREGFIELGREMLVRYREAMEKYEAQTPLPGEAEIYAKVKELNEEFLKITKEHYDVLEKNTPEGNAAIYQSIKSGKWRGFGRNLRLGIEGVAEFYTKKAKEMEAITRAERKAAAQKMILISICATLLVAAVMFMLAYRISGSLSRIAAQLSASGEVVAAASQQLSDSSQELSAAVTEQAASIQETAASVEEISSMAQKTKLNADKSSEVSRNSSQEAQQGQNVVERMIASMDQIQESNKSIMTEIGQRNENVGEIASIIRDIGQKTKVINDIVFQTKLLSFNASVEAARAGEQGKGFAVVAQEIGNLAQMSGNAATEIWAMLEESSKKVEVIVRETGESVSRLMSDAEARVSEGTDVARECGQALHSIVGASNQLSGMVSDISLASEEQSSGVAEISKAIQQLDQVTQQNAQTAADSSNASNQLSQNADLLRSVVTDLLILIEGSAPESHPKKIGSVHTPKGKPIDRGAGRSIGRAA